MNTKSVAERFENFAVLECEGSSELYKNLSLQIAKDNELLNLCLHAREGQPIPNLLFGAVHYLLLQGTDHELKEFYPSVVNEVKRGYNAFPLFKDFCIENTKNIKLILENKLVQTNEVRRCAYLYPVFCYIYQQTNKPLFLIEIGTSAGLQLLWDHYSYSYESNKLYGNKNSSVHLTSKIREGDISHNLLSLTPPVNDRLGIDLHISDLTNEEDYLWLKALIWPEHKERLKHFEDSVKQLRLNPPNLMKGDGVALLSEVVEDIPADNTICIFHTHVANQMSKSVKNELIQIVSEIGSCRDIFHIYNNIDDRKLHVDSIINGKVKHKTVGETDGHGRWFDWNLSAEVLT
ncbi:DUF2332 domain-containing protein [Halobacillus amylolyticus]|uniref:DUF2332 domain-containing protein n=1 Tax=Halobacillus amylolyticus TaxID=2932259 RepID=A0ABY4HEP2_9BACI|nr:DUF2332 domain-containing protein [Halobacillus amylolyticus]UOR12883.1 DUF2332 domain-containing protein [Halobacillus amylolyticus]